MRSRFCTSVQRTCPSALVPQRANCVKEPWWLLTCPGLKEAFTGVTVSAWHPVSVSLPPSRCSQTCCIAHLNILRRSRIRPQLSPHCRRFVRPGAVFTESPHKEGYDLTIGTSERGSNVDQATLSPFRYVPSPGDWDGASPGRLLVAMQANGGAPLV